MKKLSMFVMALISMFVVPMAFGQDAAHAVADSRPMLALAAGLAIGLGAFGGALAQGRAAAAALEGIARNPAAAEKIGTPLILGLALIESLVIYCLVMAILLFTKIPGV